MLWKRENHNQIHRNTEQISTGIVVRTGGFYFHEKPANPANQLLCVEPRYEDSDRPGVKFCVSNIRQSQEWHWKAGRILA